MNNSRTLEGGGSLQGIVEVPGDKSISHRALILGSIAEGQTTIRGFLNSEDPISTANCLPYFYLPQPDLAFSLPPNVFNTPSMPTPRSNNHKHGPSGFAPKS